MRPREEFAGGFSQKVGRILPHSVRQSLWCEALSTLLPSDAAFLIDYCARQARVSAEGKAAYLPLVDFRAVKARVGGARLYSILEMARREDFSACLLLLEDHGPRNAPDRLGPPPDPICENMSLGHRKAAARGVRSPVLERLLKDPDPRVVREALRNPRLREEEVVAIASRRPSPEELFHNLAAAPEWIKRGAVQRAVVFNPYAPVTLVVFLLVCLASQTLDEAANANGLPDAVRWGAREILSWERL